jgi:hypothetical protein
MAKTVFNVESIELLDGTVVELKPLNIRKMKEFQIRFAELQNETEKENKDGENSFLDGLLELTGICLKGPAPELASDKEKLEDTLDLESIYRIIEVSTGIKLNDPNLVQAVAASLME